MCRQRRRGASLPAPVVSGGVVTAESGARADEPPETGDRPPVQRQLGVVPAGWWWQWGGEQQQIRCLHRRRVG